MTAASKTPVARTLSTLVQHRAAAEINKRWVELPGKVVSVQGTTVTVSFDVPGLTIPQATMPVSGSSYARTPIKVGDPGVARAASAYLGTVSGLGTGSPAAAVLQPNLSALVWHPLRTDTISETTAVFTDASGASVVTLASTGITFAFGGHSIVINSSGVTIDDKAFLTHEHLPGTYNAPSGGGPVTGDSGAVV